MPSFTDIDQKLCNYCGTCVGICPTKALSAKDEKILFRKDKCISCGLCVRACPGIDVDFQKLENMVFGRKNKGLIGHHQAIYVAHAKDKVIRQNSSSGGAVTAMLLGLLKGMIHGAIVVGQDRKQPWKPMAFVAKSPKDLLSAQGSKYAMVPLNEALKYIDDNKDYAMVGLPCHIHGIRKLQLEKHPKALRIKYVIGLFCGFNAGIKGTEFLIKKSGEMLSDVKSLKYRAGDWPGGFLVEGKKKTFLPKYYYDITDTVFVPKRCLVCIDYMSELADISVGDIYLDELKRQRWSAVVVRTGTGGKILSTASLIKRKLPLTKLLKSHMHNIKHKKKGALFRMSMRKEKPDYHMSIPRFTMKERLAYGVPSMVFACARTRLFRTTVGLAPLKMLGKAAYMRRKAAGKTV